MLGIENWIVQYLLSVVVDRISKDNENPKNEEIDHKRSSRSDLCQEVNEIMLSISIQIISLVDYYSILENLLVREDPSRCESVNDW